MKLSQNLVLHSLKNWVRTFDLGPSGNTLQLGRPIFLYNQSEWPKNQICICDEVPIHLLQKPLPPESLILCHHAKYGIVSLSSNNMLELLESVSIIEVFNYLQALFDKYDAWDESLKRMVHEEESIDAFLDASSPIFQNPILLRAADYYLESYSSNIDEDPELSHLIDPNYTFETLNTSKLDPIYNEAKNNTEAFFLPEYLSGSRELCCNLFRHGILSHRLIIPEETCPLYDFQGPLLLHLSGYIRDLMARVEHEVHSTSYTIEHLLSDIINNLPVDPLVISNTMEEYGWLPNHSYCCLCLRIASLDRQSIGSQYLSRHFEEIIPGSCAFRKDDELIVFINLTRYDGTIDQLLTNTIVFLRDSFLKTGVSNAIHGIHDLRYIYMQAKLALDTGSKYDRFRWVHKFENVSLYYLMECCTKELPPYMVASQKLLILKEYDKEHHSEYYDSLKTYLDTQQNAVQTAKKLFIHRSTFLYRLDRIKELVHIDFEDADMLFYLMMSFRILELKASTLKTEEIL